MQAGEYNEKSLILPLMVNGMQLFSVSGISNLPV
jgi:hypothetical protein